MSDYRTKIQATIDYHRKRLAKLEAALEIMDEIDRSANPNSMMAAARAAAGAQKPDVLVTIGGERSSIEDFGPPPKPPTLSERVYAVAGMFGTTQFTVPEIEDALISKQNYRIPGKSRARIAMALAELERDGKVSRTKQGGGKPHLFIAKTNGMQLSR